MAFSIGWPGSLEGGEEVSSVDIWSTTVPGLGSRKCQDLSRNILGGFRRRHGGWGLGCKKETPSERQGMD